MAKTRVPESDFLKLAEYYNIHGSAKLKNLLQTEYEIKMPYVIIKRMKESSLLTYDKGNDRFIVELEQTENTVFMSMEELCAASSSCQTASISIVDNRPEAMEQLVRELIGDRLLELSRYVKLDSLSKRIIVDMTTLQQDGYQLITH